MKIMGAIYFTLVFISIMMTVLLFFAKIGPSVEVRDFTIHEIPGPLPRPQPPDRIRFSGPGQSAQVVIPMGYRMRDWAYCMDDTWSYARDAAEIPCTRHGGVRAYGPGERLNGR